MTFLELQEALREACPEDRKLTVTIVTGLTTFSSLPRYKDSTDPAVRTFPVSGEEVESGDKKLIDLATYVLFPPPVRDGRTAAQKKRDTEAMATAEANGVMPDWQMEQLVKQVDEQNEKARKKGK